LKEKNVLRFSTFFQCTYIYVYILLNKGIKENPFDIIKIIPQIIDRGTWIIFSIFLYFPFRGHKCQERGAIIPV